MSLVEKAKGVSVSYKKTGDRGFSRRDLEDITEVAIAWCKGDIKNVQMRKVVSQEYGIALGASESFIYAALRQALRDGVLVLRA